MLSNIINSLTIRDSIRAVCKELESGRPDYFYDPRYGYEIRAKCFKIDTQPKLIIFTENHKIANLNFKERWAIRNSFHKLKMMRAEDSYFREKENSDAASIEILDCLSGYS